MRYLIVESDTLMGLATLVKQMMDDDYSLVPTGAPFVTNPSADYSKDRWGQALYQQTQVHVGED